MNIIAKLKVGEQKAFGNLLRIFFEDLDCKNELNVKNGEINLRYFFKEKPPQKILDAIAEFEIVHFYFNSVETNNNTSDDIEVNKEQNIEESELVEAEVVNTEKEEIKAQQKVDEVETSALEANNPLDEIAEKSISYEEFVRNVVNELNLKNRSQLFEEIIEAAGQVNKITWKNVEAYLAERNIQVLAYDKIVFSKSVVKRFNYEKLLDFIKKIVEFKERSFTSSEVIEKGEETLESQDIVLNDIGENSRVKYLYKIPDFKVILDKVDKTKPIENRVRYVLTAMGLLDKEPKLQQELVDFATSATKIKNLSMESLFMKCNTDMQEIMETRMEFSEFINGFVSAFLPDTKIKVIDFLRDLQVVILDFEKDNEVEYF